MSSRSPDISVVMGVFDSEKYLRPAMESVLGQEDVDLEFIVVDDGSTDGSEHILREYASSDSRVRLLRTENQGLTQALIRGCAMSRCEFIARHDADDLSMPDRLARLLRGIHASDAIVMMSSWSIQIGPGGEELNVVERPVESDIATAELRDHGIGPPAHGSVMFRRSTYEAVGGYRSQFYFAQDWDLWLRMVSRGKIAYIQAPLYKYRHWPGNVSLFYDDYQKRFGQLARACYQVRSRGDSETIYLAEAEALKESFVASRAAHRNSFERESTGYYFLGALLERRRDPRATLYFREALRRRPWSIRYWMRWIRSQCSWRW